MHKIKLGITLHLYKTMEYSYKYYKKEFWCCKCDVVYNNVMIQYKGYHLRIIISQLIVLRRFLLFVSVSPILSLLCSKLRKKECFEIKNATKQMRCFVWCVIVCTICTVFLLYLICHPVLLHSCCFYNTSYIIECTLFVFSFH